MKFDAAIEEIKITVSENEKFSQNSLYSSSQSRDFVEKELDEPVAIRLKLLFRLNHKEFIYFPQMQM